MEIFKKAYGTLQMDDGTELIYDGQYLDPRSFTDPNDITGLLSPAFIIYSKLAIITFTDAQNIRLFVGHNKMLLEHKTQQQDDRKQKIFELQDEIDSYDYQRKQNRDPASQHYFGMAIE